MKFAFPFIENDTRGVAKSGLTYNHKKKWKEWNLNMPYNYYPRGGVEFSNKCKPIIWLNPTLMIHLFLILK